MVPSIFQLLILLVLFLLVVLPIIMVAKSDLVSGGEKVLWIIMAILFSWIGYIAFVITVKKNIASRLDQNKQ